MGDEKFDHNLESYTECDLIIRNYYCSKIFNHADLNKKIFWAPNGFRTGVGPRSRDKLKMSLRRQSLASFLGWINNMTSYRGERILFASSAENCKGNLYMMPSNGFAGGYNVSLYSAIMEDSIFAPCPSGNNPETIRLYDALELGCIPISLSHEFLLSADALAMIGPVPFPILTSWSELPQFLDEMKVRAISSPEEILLLQQKCINWWTNFKAAISQKIANRIQSL